MKDAIIGSRINRYEIRESLHKSDLIGIYKAYDTKLERFVFLKTILHSADYSQEAVDFFISESRSLAKLAHPNIAKVLDFGYEEGNLYLISEYVTGKPLSELMDGPMPWQKAVNILLPLMDALIYAHSKNIIHRDLKPENITVNSDGQPTLSDFSLIRIIEEEETRDMTGTNVGLGSASYISPEQGKGLTVDFRSDIYSLGVIFFEMVTGKKLFYSANSMEIVLQHIMADPPKPRNIIPSLPKSIEDVILNALSKDRDKRFQSMEEFSNALKIIVEDSNKAKNKPKPAIGARVASIVGIVLVIGITLAWGIWRNTLATPTEMPIRLTPTINLPPATKPSPIVERIVTPTPTQTPEDRTWQKFSLASIPVLPGTKLPTSDLINANNAENITELARWGIPNVNQFVFFDEDKVLLAGTSAGVYYFDPKDLSARLLFDTEGEVTTLDVSDDNEWIVTGSQKGDLIVWSAVDGTKIHQYKIESGIKSISIASDKSKLVFSDSDNNIYLWNFDQSQPYPFEKRHTRAINKVIFLSDGKTVISGSEDFQIRTWDVPRRVALKNYPASKQILDMVISSNGERLAVALNTGKIEIWDIKDSQNSAKVTTIVNTPLEIPVTHIAFLTDNLTVVAGSDDGIIRLWNVDTGEKVWEIPPQGDDTTSLKIIKTLAVSKDGKRFVAMFEENGLVEVWSITEQKLEVSRHFKHEEIKGIAISPDDSAIAVQKGDTFVEILTATDASQSAKIVGTLPRGNPISPNNKMLIVKSDKLVLDLYTLSALNPQKLSTLYDFPLDGSVTYLPDNSIIAASSSNNLFYWSTSSGMELQVNDSQKILQGRCMVFKRRDGKVLAAGSVNGVIYSEENLGRYCNVTRNPAAISEEFPLDGSIIALSAKNSPIIDVWDLHAGDQKIEITSQTSGYVLDVAISKDRKLLASVSTDGLLEIYNLGGTNLLKTLDLHTGPINQVLFSNNGKYIITGSTDGTIRFFGLYP